MNHRDLTPEEVTSFLLDSEPYFSCDDCFAHLDEYVEQVVADPAHRDLPMQVHLAACGACAEEAATLIEILAADHE